jgi:hypothetical protein
MGIGEITSTSLVQPRADTRGSLDCSAAFTGKGRERLASCRSCASSSAHRLAAASYNVRHRMADSRRSSVASRRAAISLLRRDSSAAPTLGITLIPNYPNGSTTRRRRQFNDFKTSREATLPDSNLCAQPDDQIGSCYLNDVVGHVGAHRVGVLPSRSEAGPGESRVASR